MRPRLRAHRNSKKLRFGRRAHRRRGRSIIGSGAHRAGRSSTCPVMFLHSRSSSHSSTMGLTMSPKILNVPLVAPKRVFGFSRTAITCTFALPCLVASTTGVLRRVARPFVRRDLVERRCRLAEPNLVHPVVGHHALHEV